MGEFLEWVLWWVQEITVTFLAMVISWLLQLFCYGPLLLLLILGFILALLNLKKRGALVLLLLCVFVATLLLRELVKLDSEIRGIHERFSYLLRAPPPREGAWGGMVIIVFILLLYAFFFYPLSATFIGFIKGMLAGEWEWIPFAFLLFLFLTVPPIIIMAVFYKICHQVFGLSGEVIFLLFFLIFSSPLLISLFK